MKISLTAGYIFLAFLLQAPIAEATQYPLEDCYWLLTRYESESEEVQEAILRITEVFANEGVLKGYRVIGKTHVSDEAFYSAIRYLVKMGF